MTGRHYYEWEILHPDHWSTEDGQGKSVFIPDEPCCGKPPWNCRCEHQCERDDDETGEQCTGKGHGPRPLCERHMPA